MIVFVNDRFGKQKYALSDFIKFVHDDELGSFDFIDLTVPGNHVQKGDYLLWKDYSGKWREHIVSNEDVLHTSSGLVQTIHAPNSITEVSRNFFDDAIYFTNIDNALRNLLNKTRWTLGKIDNIESLPLWLRKETVYEGLCDIKAVAQESAYFTTEVETLMSGVEKRTLNYVKSIGRDSGIIFYYGYDTDNVERIVNVDEIITRLHCFGKDYDDEVSEEDEFIYQRYKRKFDFVSRYGVDYVEDNEAKEKYGIPDKNGILQHSEGIYIDNRFASGYKDKGSLYRAGLERLKEVSKPRVTYKAKINTLLKEQYGNTDIFLGDTITVNDEVLNESITNQIVRIRRDYVDVKNTDITLGKVVRTARISRY